MKKIVLLNFLTFVAAFLLFQIELITAKILLPNYGGSFMVWGSCMVFFQAALLAGYAFSHFIIEKIGIARYKIVYIILLSFPLLFFPGQPLRFGLPSEALPLSLDIFGQLLKTIGPVFFVLSTVSLFTQVWLTSSQLPEKANPYALYGWSNLGSFLALLTYPFIFEFYFDLQEQATMWRVLYGLFILLNIVVLAIIPTIKGSLQSHPAKASVSHHEIKDWLLLSGGGVMMFLAVTNILTMEIAPIPLLWIIPLAIYLLAFVLNFKQKPWCPSWINKTIHWMLGFSLVLFFVFQHQILPVVVEVLLSCTLLFIISMYCQNQLILKKPAAPQNLTFFYLMISLGGFIGGLVTSWVIPVTFASIAEYLIALTLIALTLPLPTQKLPNGRLLRMMIYLFVFLFMWPMYFRDLGFWSMAYLIVFCGLIFKELSRGVQALAMTFLLAIVLMPYLEMSWENKVFIYKKRNYYGIFKIFDRYGMRTLHHGTILHGMQFKDPAMRQEPTAYYGKNSPVRNVLLSTDFKFKKIGIVGLGTGTLAAYFQGDQSVDFYELDPDVIDIAEKYFNFITDLKAIGRYIIGDARVALAQNSQSQYDLLIIDAFSGDSVPAHLLTKEMFEIYRQRLSPQGIVLFHISNKYLDLSLVTGSAAAATGGRFCYLDTKEVQRGEIISQWMALTWDQSNFDKLTSRMGWKASTTIVFPRPWTDQYMNVIPVFHWKIFLKPFRDFLNFK